MVHLFLDRELRPYTFYVQGILSRLGLDDQNADVLFNFTKLEEEDLDGYCVGDSDFIEVYIDSDLCQEELLKTLAHELVHVKQLILEQEYSETEAYGLEDTLYKLFWSEKNDASSINNIM